MTFDRTGLDPVENAIIEALHTVGAGATGPHQKTTVALREVNQRHGYAPDDVYTRILALARPWLTSLRLVDFHGNYGGRSFGPANARYTEVRLTPLGEVAARAIADAGPALPIGLIMGDTYKGGIRPPHDHERMVAALRLVNDGGDDAEILTRVGAPAFPTRCRVEGDVDALQRGMGVRLTLTAEVTEVDERALKVTRLPPESSETDLTQHLRRLHETIPLVDVEDHSTALDTNLLVRLGNNADIDAARQAILQTWGVYRYVQCSYRRPLVDLLREWVQREGGTLTGLDHIADG